MTKHKCLENVIEDYENSSEEEKLIGKCENCDGSQVEIISVSQSGSSQTKKRQKTLEGIFRLKQKKKMNILQHNRNLLTLKEWLQ